MDSIFGQLSQLAHDPFFWIEVAAVLTGMACVWLTVIQKIACWPFGIISAGLFIIIFDRSFLYGQMLLQGLFVILSIYGWYNWRSGGAGRDDLPVTRIRLNELIILALLVAAGTVGGAQIMIHWTNAAQPWLDALTTSMSIAAQWLLARKILESWIVWISVDIILIGLYAYSELYPTTLLYVIFLIMATIGLFSWQRSHQRTALKPG